jgi:hypothetical protein
MNLQLLSEQLLEKFKDVFTDRLDAVIDSLDKIETPVDYFQFYNSISKSQSLMRWKIM